MLALVSLLMPFGEMIALRRLAPAWSTIWFAEFFLSIYAVYWWYVMDKRERNFRTGAIQNFGVIFLSVVGLPVYLVRSRGWKRGALATLGALGVLLVVSALAYMGEAAGEAIAAIVTRE
jgi:hypothetical protein